MRRWHGYGVFMAIQNGRCHGLSALPGERSPAAKGHTRANLTFAADATSRLPSPKIEQTFPGDVAEM
jgi:hypothetical protein